MPEPAWQAVERAVSSAVEEGLGDLLGALRIPSISAHGEGLRESADYLATVLRRDGWSVEVVELDGNPIVLAEAGPPDAPSLIVYGHHDVQPVDPEAAWISPPFAPRIEAGRIYARGSADNKGQFFCHLFAANALRRALGGLPVRVKLVLDGWEEIGSPQLPAFLERFRSRLAGARLCLTADGPTRLPDVPEVVFGVRGTVKLKLTVRTADTDLHSGNWGNIVPSAAWRLARVLVNLKEPSGRVTVPGFYDRAIPPTDLEREALAEIPFDVQEAGDSVGAVILDGPPEVPPLERIMFLPTMTVVGISGGYTGEGFKTVIPSTAFAYLDVRLVAAQDPDWMFELLRDHLARVAPEAALERLGHYLPSRTPLDTPAATQVLAAVERGFGRRPLRVPCAGGSLPDGSFASILGIPVLDVPYGTPDQRNHAPNENMRIDHLRKGALTSAALFLGLGWEQPAGSGGR